MKRIVSKVISTPQRFGDKWRLIVESRNYGKAPNHILEFESKEEADRVGIGYVYSTDDIYRESHKAKLNTLSVKQPFALLEVLGIKDVENRTWKTDYRGRIYIHACAWKKGQSIYQLTEEQKYIVSGYPIVTSLLEEKELMCSAIIGHVELVDIVEDSSSVWAMKGHYHWILADAVMFDSTIVNVKGNLNLWDCSGYVR